MTGLILHGYRGRHQARRPVTPRGTGAPRDYLRWLESRARGLRSDPEHDAAMEALGRKLDG